MTADSIHTPAGSSSAGLGAGHEGLDHGSGVFGSPGQGKDTGTVQDQDHRFAGGAQGFQKLLLYAGQDQTAAVLALAAGNLDPAALAAQGRDDDNAVL